MQAETLASAYRLWRRNWKGKGREYTAGALVWQVSPMFGVLLPSPHRSHGTPTSPAYLPTPTRPLRHADCFGFFFPLSS